MEPWEEVGLTKEEWDGLDIPHFLLRQSYYTPPAPPAAKPRPASTPLVTTTAIASGAAVSAGSLSGSKLNIDQFRVDPAEIEAQIKREADRRYRTWAPSKDEIREGRRTRPRLSTFLKQVRKEFYP